jgi:nitrite reductase/ring-hydroxylating ferredoxin subunit
MVTGFEVNIKGCAVCSFSSLLKGKHLCMRLTQARMIAFSHNFAILDNHCPHQWIRGGFAASLPSQVKTTLHDGLIKWGAGG